MPGEPQVVGLVEAIGEGVTGWRIGDRAGVKAAGGIRSAADVQRMLEAGADRIGTSTAAQILRELGAV